MPTKVPPGVGLEDRVVLRLALAVLDRAKRDLLFYFPRNKKYVAEIRADAKAFLLDRLWEDDNLWGGILGPYISSGAIRRVVKQQLRRSS